MRRLLFPLLLLLVLAGCTSSPATPTPAVLTPTAAATAIATRQPTNPPAPATPTSTPPPAPVPDASDAWQPLAAGVEVLRTGDGLSALRHAPKVVQYSAQFQPDPNQGRSVGGWLSEDPQAIAAINCGFYRDDRGAYRHIGLLMTEGEALSKLRAGWGGVLIVRNGEAAVVPKPKRLIAPARLGLQGWPMLIENRTRIPQLNAGDLARRTAVGVDNQGRVVWVVAPLGMTLADFAQRLLEQDLGLVEAVNLDGGASTGLRWRAQPNARMIGPDSLPIPCAVLLSPA